MNNQSAARATTRWRAGANIRRVLALAVAATVAIFASLTIDTVTAQSENEIPEALANEVLTDDQFEQLVNQQDLVVQLRQSIEQLPQFSSLWVENNGAVHVAFTDPHLTVDFPPELDVIVHTAKFSFDEMVAFQTIVTGASDFSVGSG